MSLLPDGWTMNDLIYRWTSNNPVQMTGNLSLPGGFKLDGFSDRSCDVQTATGKGSTARALRLGRPWGIGLNSTFTCRFLQLLEGGAHIRKTIVLLHRDDICPVFPDRYRFLDVVLDRPQGCELSLSCSM